MSSIASVLEVSSALSHTTNPENLFPGPIATLIAQFAMTRFEDVTFGPEHWKTCYGATPVTLPTLEVLRERVSKYSIEFRKELPKPTVEQMSVAECANFIHELGEESCPEPPEELFECLNKPLRPKENLAGFIVTATFIPEYVRKDGRIIAVTARTLAVEFGPNPGPGAHAAELTSPDLALHHILTEETTDTTQPPCYFVMEQDVVPDTKGKKPEHLLEQIKSQGDKGWDVPEPRNFMAAVFSRRAWKGDFLFGKAPWAYTICKSESQDGNLVVTGGFGEEGLYLTCYCVGGSEAYGACGSRKFQSQLTPQTT